MTDLLRAVSTADSPPPDQTFLYLQVGIAGSIVAAIVLWIWPQALSSRWSSEALAAVHLFSIGSIAPTMIGAMFQFIPVASGMHLQAWGRAEFVLLASLPLSALLLASGFLAANRGLLGTGAALALCALGVVAVRLARALWGQPAAAAVTRGLRAGAIGLIGMLVVAAVLAYDLAVRASQPAMAAVDVHALWAVVGWVGVMIASVTSVIVPMFHVTEAYPSPWMRVVTALPAALGVATVAGWLQAGAVLQAVECALALSPIVFGALTLGLIARSRRKSADAFRWGWIAASMLAICCGLLGAIAAVSDDGRWSSAFGVCTLAGVIGITITTMIYRIVPFLTWLHWQRYNKARIRLPLIHEIVPAKPQLIQLALQVSAVVLLVAGCFVEPIRPFGAVLLVAAQATLLVLILKANRLYERTLATLKQLPARQRDDGH